MATVASDHPMRRLVDQEGRRIPATHKSPLHHLFMSTGVHMGDFKPEPTNVNLSRTLNRLHVQVADSKEEAISDEVGLALDVMIFTDSSMKDGRVGVAAVLIRRGQPVRTLKVYLGSDREHEVYEAEILGIQLGLHLLATEEFVDEAAIFTDNQAVLKTIQSG